MQPSLARCRKRLSGLLGIKLDDEVLLEGEVNVVPLRKGSDLSHYLSLIKLDPLGSDVRIKGLDERLELLGRTALLTKSDNVTCTNDEGRNVYLLTVKTEVTVSYELTSFLTAVCKTDSVDNVVETSLKEAEEVLTCNAFGLLCLLEVTLELVLENAVVSLCLLLLAKLETVLLYVLSAGAMLTGNGRMLLKCTLTGKATVALQEKLGALSAAKSAHRACISCHTVIPPVLIIRDQTLLRLGGRQPL